jgi:uncharacterized protein (TIGR02268 family)
MPAAVLLLALLSAAFASAQPVPESWNMVAARHLELTADSAQWEHEVGISPLLTTTLVFNAQLLRGGVVVEEREHFRAVTVDEAAGFVALLPTSALPPGKHLRLTVRFADGALPASVTFRLVVHATQAESQVNVYRHPRSGESYQQEARQERERAERCEARLVQAEQQHPRGLTGLLADNLVMGNEAVEARDILRTLKLQADSPLRLHRAHSYRALGRVAVGVELENTSSDPWVVDGNGARLAGKGGKQLHVLSVWPLEPLPPGERRHVFIEAEATAEEARGTYILQLAETSGPRTLLLRGVTFPDMD